MRRRLSVLAAFMIGCSSFSTGTNDTRGVDGGGGGGDAGGDGGGGDSGVVDGGARPAGSCKSLLERDSSLATKDGVYEITVSSASVTSVLKVYCDFTIDGGGWTLVGRSANVGTNEYPFGWRSTTGNVEQIQFPYSLNAAAANLTFREVLVAERDPTSSKPVNHAYKFGVPVDFLEKRDSTISTGTITKIFGDCTLTKQNEPEMLRFVGATALEDIFFVRDLEAQNIKNGLRPSKFDLAWNECFRGGGLHDKQGVLFVR